MKSKRKIIGKIFSVLESIILILLLVLCVSLTVPKLFGYDMYHIISGSMEPNIPIGSLVYSKKIEPSMIQEDDVIVFYSSVNDGAVITHRVVKNKNVSGEIVTKGDANDANDPLPVEYDRVIGKVELIVPKLGVLASLVAKGIGKILIVSGIGLVIILQLLVNLLNKKEEN